MIRALTRFAWVMFDLAGLFNLHQETGFRALASFAWIMFDPAGSFNLHVVP